MEKYPKIKTVYLHDPATKYKTVLEGQFALPEFEYLANNQWVFTEKIDGMNIRVNWNSERVLFSGRTDKALIPACLSAKLQGMFPQGKFAALYPETPMTLYGEGYGARVRKGGGNYIPDGVDFILFDVMIGNIWLERENVEDIACQLGIKTVPIITEGTLYAAIEITRDGYHSHLGSQIAEGFVMRPAIELLSRRGHRIITKIKYKDFPHEVAGAEVAR